MSNPTSNQYLAMQRRLIDLAIVAEYDADKATLAEAGNMLVQLSEDLARANVLVTELRRIAPENMQAVADLRGASETACCIWTPDEPAGEFFFTTACGERGVNKEDSYKFCPYCSSALKTEPEHGA